MALSINLKTYPPSPTSHHPRPPRRYIKRTCTFTAIAAIFFFILLFVSRSFLSLSPNPGSTLQTITWIPTRLQSSVRIAKATIAYSPSNNIYNRSLTLHAAQGYKTHVLQTPLVRGFSNTYLWLQHVITSEMLKVENARVEWILFFHPSILPSNPHILLQTFLPPIDSTDFKALSIVGTKSNGVMNSSLFFVRVSALSLRILGAAISAVHIEPYKDWGDDLVAATLQFVLEREEYRDKVVWQRKEWYDGSDAAFVQPGVKSGVEGLIEVEKVLQGRDVQEKGLDRREMYPSANEVKMFWDTVVEAGLVLKEAGYRGHTSGKGEFAEGVQNLKNWVELRTWDVVGVTERLEVLKEQLGIGEVIGRAMNIG